MKTITTTYITNRAEEEMKMYDEVVNGYDYYQMFIREHGKDDRIYYSQQVNEKIDRMCGTITFVLNHEEETVTVTRLPF